MEAAVSAAMRGEKCELPDAWKPVPPDGALAKRLWDATDGDEIDLVVVHYSGYGPGLDVIGPYLYKIDHREKTDDGVYLVLKRARRRTIAAIGVTLAYSVHGDLAIQNAVHYLTYSDETDEVDVELFSGDVDVNGLKSALQRADCAPYAALERLAELVKLAGQDKGWRRIARRAAAASLPTPPICSNCAEPGHVASSCPQHPMCRWCKGAPHPDGTRCVEDESDSEKEQR